MSTVTFYAIGEIADTSIGFAVIVARSRGYYLLCRHKDRLTWECPGGHREKGETLLQTARRELYEETGATDFTLTPVCVYGVAGVQGETYGMLYQANVHALGPKPDSEIAEVVESKTLPKGEQWTYPHIQPELLPGIPAQPEHAHVIEHVPFISQLVKYPTGCESIAAVMALQYLGLAISPETFIDEYLPQGPAPKKGEDGRYYGCDPWKAFPGTPYTDEGWGCFAPVIVEAVGCIPGYRAEAQYGLSLDEICRRYIARDIPVLFWATIDMADPVRQFRWYTERGRCIQWVNPMHCLLLIGYDEKGYIFNDPTAGERAYYPKAQVQLCYHAQGEQMVTITKENEAK